MITLDDKMKRVYDAFRTSFDTELEYVIQEITEDYIIVKDYEAPAGEFFKVTYVSTEDSIVFQTEDQWETVEKEYVSTTPALESFKSTNARKLKESNNDDNSITRVGRSIRAIGITADVINRNNRVYPKVELERAIGNLKESIALSNGQGRFQTTLLGEVEHPEDKLTQKPNLNEVAIKWNSVDFADGKVLLEGTVLDTPAGNILLTLLENGIHIGISQRALGRELVRPDGVSVIKDLTIKGYDAVYAASDPNGQITQLMESIDISKEIRQILEANTNVLQGFDFSGLCPSNVKDIVESLRKHLNLGDDDLVVEFEKLAERNAQAVKAALVESITALEDSELIIDRVNDFVNVEDATNEIQEIKTKLEASEAQARILALGGNTKMTNIESVVPVIERELGVPEYAKSIVESQSKLIESGKSNLKSIPDFKNPKTRGQAVAFKLLENYTKRFQYQLKKESEMFAEAMGSADLALPYTVNANIILEAFPMLVSAEVFNFQPMAQNPSRFYYETFSGDAAADLDKVVAATAINAFAPAFVPAAIGLWAAFPNSAKNITPGTVAFSGGFVEATDYIIDYRGGRIKTITAGFAAAAGATTLAFTWRTTQNPENSGITRVKQVLQYKDITAVARRLAATITHEAYVFGDSDLSYDAHAAAVRGAADALARELDQNVLYAALTELLQVTSNTVTYSRANAVDAVSTGFNVRVGEAKAKLEKRYYDATKARLIVDVDQAELMSNSQLFSTSLSRPDFNMSSAGVVGEWKGIPTFKSPLFAGGAVSWAMVVMPELMNVGIFSPIETEGPYPTYADDATGRLVDAKSYLVRMVDAVDCVIQNKGSLVKITA